MQREGPGHLVVGSRPRLGQITDDLGIAMRVEGHQGVVYWGKGNRHQEGGFLMHVQAGRVAGQGYPQYPAMTRFLLCQSRWRCPQPCHHHYTEYEPYHFATSHHRPSCLRSVPVPGAAPTAAVCEPERYGE